MRAYVDKAHRERSFKVRDWDVMFMLDICDAYEIGYGFAAFKEQHKAVIDVFNYDYDYDIYSSESQGYLDSSDRIIAKDLKKNG